LAKVSQAASGAAGQAASAAGAATTGALDPTKFVNFKLKAVEVSLFCEDGRAHEREPVRNTRENSC
jgi:hypothetical protein